MDLKQRLDELRSELTNLAAERQSIYEQMKEIRKKMQKYKTVLKHAESIESESVEEKPLV